MANRPTTINLLRFNTVDKRIYFEQVELAEEEKDIIEHIVESTLEMIGEEEDQPITVIKKYVNGIEAYITEEFQTHHIWAYSKDFKGYLPSADDLEEDWNEASEMWRETIGEKKEVPVDEFPIRCTKCNTVYGTLGHLRLYNKPICNKCCDTAIMIDGLFKGCKCA